MKHAFFVSSNVRPFSKNGPGARSCFFVIANTSVILLLTSASVVLFSSYKSQQRHMDAGALVDVQCVRLG